MTVELTFNPQNEEQMEKLNKFLEETFPNSPHAAEKYDRLADLYKTLEPFVRISPSSGRGGDIELYKIDEGNGELHHYFADAGEITWVEPDDENNLSTESIIESLNQIL